MKNVSAIILFILFSCPAVHAQLKKRVLFIGNSYTYVNNMPQIVADIAATSGDTLIYEMEAPGGFMLMDHYNTNPPTLNKIMAGNWDYMVLQEQSQAPALPLAYVQTGVYPYAHKLDSLFNIYNPCGETIFYMTWGRKNGDASYCSTYAPQGWPYYCSYHLMDSIIRERYMDMADSNQAQVSPASAVWRYVRANNPGIDLYQSDNSHPSEAGSYAAACAFYTAIFRKDPALTTYNYTLSATDAANIRMAAKKVAFDSINYWHIGQYVLDAGFTHAISGVYQLSFTNTSVNASSYSWNFGDGQTSTQTNPVHTYSAGASYNVRLIASNSSCADTIIATVNANSGFVGSNGKTISFVIAPNPAHDVVTIRSSSFLSKQYSIHILNALGQQVGQFTTARSEEQCADLSKLPAGNYVLSVYDKDACIYRSRVVKAPR